MSEQTEVLAPQETTVSLKETASALQRQQDAVFDGNNLRIGFLEKDEKGNNLTEGQRKQQAEKLAQRLNDLKDSQDKPILSRRITAKEVEELPDEIQKLISEGKLSGILVNILGNQPQSSEASALAMVVFLDYIKANPDKPHSELLQKGYQRVTEVLKIAYPQAPELLSFAFSLIDKEGNLSAIVLGDQQITTFNKEGQKKGEGIKEEKEADGSPKIQTLKLEKGDKIFVCHKDKADQIDGTKGVKEEVDRLTKEKTDTSSAGAGEKGEEKQEPITIPQGVDAQEALRRLSGEGPIVIDDKDNQSETYTLDDFRKAIAPAQTGEDFRITQLRERIQKINQFLSDADVQKTLTEILPKKDGESDEQYRLRCLLAIKERLAKPGRFEKANDKLSVLLINKGFRSEVVTPQFLQALEGIYYLEVDRQNQEKLRLWEEARSQGKWDIATFISLQRGIVDIGGSIGVFENTPEGKRRREAAERDMRAALLLINAFASLPYEIITDSITGQKRVISFHEKMEPLLKARQEAKTDQEREEISRRIEGEYKIYLQRLEEAMRKREWQVNPFGQDEIFQKEAWQQLQLLKPPFTQDKFDQLIELYKQSPSFKRLWKEAQRSSEKYLRETFSRDIGALPDFLGYAQKGIEFLERRMELLRVSKPELEEIPQIIYPKKWVEVGEELPQELLDSILTTGRTTQRAKDEIDVDDKGKKDGDENGNGKKDGGKSDLEAAPTIAEPPKKDDNTPPPASDGRPSQKRSIELPGEYNFAIVAPPEEVNQQVGALAEHYRASEKPALSWKIIFKPRALFKNIWQNTFLSQIFYDQAIRFGMGLTEAVRRRLGIDSSVPIQLTPELMDKALVEGQRLRKQQSFRRKVGFIIRDLFANILGIGQSSKMILAREWLENQASNEEINSLLTQSLRDQTDFAQRFALEEVSGLKPISEEIGETRFLLEERVHDPQLVGGLKGKIKELALAVCNGAKSRELALTELNRYFKTEIYPHLPPDIQKELEGIELSSNLLNLIDFLQKQDAEGKTYLQLYQEQQGREQGKTRWDELDFKIYLGKGRYETSRGDVELTGLQKKLIRRMMERNYAKENGFQFSDVPRVVELLKDVGIFGGSYIWGGLLGARSFGRGIAFRLLHLNPMTGTLSMTLLAGLREGPAIASKGRLKGIAGKTWRDFVQVSRETGQGRISQENAVLRKQFEALLVDQRSATELTEAITQLLKKETLTPDEQRQLLLAIAHAQARLRMTDLSTRRGKRYLGVGDIEVPQNFITYNFDKRNKELTALRSAILDGAAKLSQANPEMLGRLQQVQAVFEAQLRVGSVKEKLAGVIARENNLSQQQAQDLVNQFFVDLGVTEDKSLEGSAKRLAGLTWRRMRQTIVMSAVAGAATKIVFYPAFGELFDLGRHLFGYEGGLKEYLSDWNEVIHGNIPIEVDSHGNFVADLSPLQRGLIQGPYLLHNLGADRLFHTEIPRGETINLGNAQINMPSGYHFQQADYNGDGITDTVLVNKAAGGEIVFGVSGYHLGAVDIDGDGQLNLVLQDQNGQVLIDPTNGRSSLEELLQSSGINISPPQEVIVSSRVKTSTETIFSLPGGQHPEQVGNLIVQTPDGTHWVDNHDGTYDLIAQDSNGNPILDSDGKPLVLVDNAEIVDNHLVITRVHPDFTHSILNNTGGSERLVTGEEARGFWEKIVSQPEKQVWWTNATRGSDYQELRLYNQVYQDTNGNLGIRFIAPTGQGSIDGVNFYQVEDYARAHGGMQLSFVIPGLGHLRVDMDCDGMGSDNDFWLSTDNHNEVLSNGMPVIMPDGHHLTIAELARMVINQLKLQDYLRAEGITVSSNPVSLASEYRGWLDIFNLGINGKSGFIVAGFTDENGVFNHLATIRGSGDLTAIIREISEPVLQLTGSITQEIRRVLEDKILVFTLTASPPRFSISPWFIPVRENIEKSVRADKTVPSSTSQGPAGRGTSQTTQQPQISLTPEQKQKKEQILNLARQEEQRLNGIIGLTDETKKNIEIAKIAQEIGKSEEEVEQAIADENKRKELALDLALRKMAEESLTDEEKKKDKKEIEEIIKQRMKELRQILETETQPTAIPHSELLKRLGIDPEKLSPRLKEEYQRNLEPKIKEFEEAIKSGDKERINKARDSLIIALGQFNQKARGDSSYTPRKPPEELVTELESSLQIVKPEDELRIDLDEKTYQGEKRRILDLLKRLPLNQLNQELKSLGLSGLTQQEFDQLKTDSRNLDRLTRKIIIAMERKRLEERIKIQIINEEIKKLSEEEKRLYEQYSQVRSQFLLLQQLRDSLPQDDPSRSELEQNLNEVGKQLGSLQQGRMIFDRIEKQVSKKSQEYQQLIEQEVRRLKREIKKWEHELEISFPVSHERRPIKENILYRRKIRIIPDLHGSILDKFLSDFSEDELLISVGDIFDRGQHSWQAAEKMMGLVREGRAIWNYGNHELIFMAAMIDDSYDSLFALGTWFLNGGDEMARAVGIDLRDYDEKIEEAHKRLGGGDSSLSKTGEQRDLDLLSQAKRAVVQDVDFMKTISERVRNNRKLKELFDFLRSYGMTYCVADSVLITHAGLLVDDSGNFLPVIINGQDFGTGIEAMDRIQEEIRKGNRDVILWLANNDEYQGNPFWLRDRFIKPVGSLQSADRIIRGLNQQLTKKGTKVNLVVVGHTSSFGGKEFITETSPDKPKIPRFLFIDTDYYKRGEPFMVRLIVPKKKEDDDEDEVIVLYTNPVTKQIVSSQFNSSRTFEYKYGMN